MDTDAPGQDALTGHLDNDNDFLVSERIRRQDVASNLSSPRLGGRRSPHAKVTNPKPNEEILATKKEAEPPTATVSARSTEMRPLFSDDIFTSDTGGKVELETRESTTRKMQPSRRILENLLDCERDPNYDGKNVRPPSRTRTRPSSERGSGQVTKGGDTDDLDSKHLRKLSGFSFVAGDDAFTTSTGGRGSSETTRAAALRGGGGNSIALRQYGMEISHHAEEDSVKGRDAESSASSADTVIRADREMTIPATRHSPATAKETVHILPRQT
ncbi:hypothetical protein F4818DRAFT_189466 [Hypoxylon cercidicola]|nr:hypothetical protein F4818DRAFT_189466 [Hypoxylon cercidicola]